MQTLLEMSVTGGILVAVLVIVRAVTINKLPKNVFLVLWAVALCRLLIPFAVPSPTSVYSAAAQVGVTVRRPGLLLSQTTQETASAASPLPVLLLVYAAVAALCALVFLVLHLRARSGYRVSLPVENRFVKLWMEQHRLRRPVQVRYSDQITAPLTYGVIWPVILLPKALDWTDETRLAFILAHEMAHVRRFDALWKWVLAAAFCLHWFNPLVWVMYVLSGRDLELSCDEQVMRAYGRESRAPYALTLVALEEKRAHFLPLASGFSKNAMEERITAIMKGKKTTIAGIAAALVLIIVVTMVFATSAAPKDPAPASAATPSPSTAVSPLDPPSEPSEPAAVTPPVISGAEIADAIKGKWEGSWDDEGWKEPVYTQKQYDLVIEKLKFSGWEKMTIAEFNRKINAAFRDSEENIKNYEDGLHYAYEMVLMTLPDSDPNAAFLRNTVQASVDEYDARLSEVYNDKHEDPSFRGSAERVQNQDVYGDSVRTHTFTAEYEFTYRILEQDKLTVAARDAFLQAVMQGAQDYLGNKTIGEIIDDNDPETSFKTALDAAGKAASNSSIEFTGSEIDYFQSDY